MTIYATILCVENCQLLVCDHCTRQQVLVRTANACCFCPGEQVCIHYCGPMSTSNPPQVTATCITRLPSCGCC